MPAEADKPPAIHIAGTDGVTFKTCTAEVFRPASKDENRSFQVFETRKDLAVHVSLSSSSLVKQPGTRRPHSHGREVRKTPFRRQMTTDLHRLLLHSSKRGASRARKHALACGPMQRRAQWPVYKPARSALSTPVVNKSSHRPRESRTAKKSLFLRTLRRT